MVKRGSVLVKLVKRHNWGPYVDKKAGSWGMVLNRHMGYGYVFIWTCLVLGHRYHFVPTNSADSTVEGKY